MSGIAIYYYVVDLNSKEMKTTRGTYIYQPRHLRT